MSITARYKMLMKPISDVFHAGHSLQYPILWGRRQPGRLVGRSPGRTP
jgi:hypothetical protein